MNYRRNISRCDISIRGQEIARDGPLPLNEGVKLHVKSALRITAMVEDRVVDSHWTSLSDTVGSVGCLIFLRRIPPASIMDDVVCSSDVEAGSGSEWTQQ